MISWKEIGHTIGVVLLLGVVALNLYFRNDILTSVFRGVVVYLVFSIINITLSKIIVQQLHRFEVNRLKALQEEEEREEEERLEQERLAQQSVEAEEIPE